MLLSLLSLTVLVVVLCAVGAVLTVVPFVVGVELAERRGYATLRWGLVSAAGPALGLLLAYAVHGGLPAVLYLPAAVLCWVVPGVLLLLAPGLSAGGRQGLHER